MDLNPFTGEGNVSQSREEAQTSDYAPTKRFLKAHLPGLLAALFAGMAGLLPHVVFSRQMGEWSYFKGAWDEEHYVSDAFKPQTSPHRIFGSLALRGAYWLGGKDSGTSAVICDFIFPFLLGCMSWIASGWMARTVCIRVLISLSIVFGSDILMLNNQVIHPAWMTVTEWRNHLPEMGRKIVPQAYQVYFSVYRTPEPQASLIFFLVFHIVFLKLLRKGIRPYSAGFILFFMTSNLMVPFVYSFIGLAILVVQGTYALLLLASRKWKDSSALILAGGFGFVWLMLVQVFFAQPDSGTLLIFGSRLPVVTPAMVFSVVFLGWEAMILLRTSSVRPRQRLGLAHLLAILVLFNQQVLTGTMVMSISWERHIAYSLLILGVANLKGFRSAFFWLRSRCRRVVWLPRIAVLLIGALVIRGQYLNYKMFKNENVYSCHYVRAVKQALQNVEAGGLRIMMEDPYFKEPLVNFRLNYEVPFVDGYSYSIWEPIGLIPRPGTAPSGRRKSQERAFEQFAREGLLPEELEQGMRTAWANKSCWPYLIAFFSFLDCWAPASDERLVKTEEIEKQINWIVRDYRRYLDEPKDIWNTPVLWITPKSPEEISSGAYWTHRLAGSSEFGRRRRKSAVYAYLQVPKKWHKPAIAADPR